ncbi:hypothetical protein [Streptomyces sp. NPDC050534]|uniref:hypothetical protein n=1 Tax=Streptomyces sp. NPDC050534 TaxID=3365625 RepID=UPI00379830A6
MPWSSKLPAALDALVVAFQGWPRIGGDKVIVKDGPSTSQTTGMEVVSVGWTGGDDENGAESTLLTEGLSGQVDREQFTIRCVIAVLRGSDDMASARKRAYELFSEAGAAIAADRRLGGAVMRAMISSHSLDQAQTQQGAQASVMFDVSCDAYSGT